MSKNNSSLSIFTKFGNTEESNKIAENLIKMMISKRIVVIDTADPWFGEVLDLCRKGGFTRDGDSITAWHNLPDEDKAHGHLGVMSSLVNVRSPRILRKEQYVEFDATQDAVEFSVRLKNAKSLK